MSFDVNGLKFDDYEYRLNALSKIQSIEDDIENIGLEIRALENYIRINNNCSQDINETRDEIDNKTVNQLKLISEQTKLKIFLNIDPNMEVKKLNINVESLKQNRNSFKDFYNKLLPKPPFNWNKQR